MALTPFHTFVVYKYIYSLGFLLSQLFETILGLNFLHPSSAYVKLGHGENQPKQWGPDFTLHSHFVQLFQGIVRHHHASWKIQSLQHVPGLHWGLLPMEHAQKSSSGGVRTHPNQMTNPLHLAPLGVEVQQLYSEVLQDDQTSHPGSMREPSHPTEEAHFGCRGLAATHSWGL